MKNKDFSGGANLHDYHKKSPPARVGIFGSPYVIQSDAPVFRQPHRGCFVAAGCASFVLQYDRNNRRSCKSSLTALRHLSGKSSFGSFPRSPFGRSVRFPAFPRLASLLPADEGAAFVLFRFIPEIVRDVPRNVHFAVFAERDRIILYLILYFGQDKLFGKRDRF